MYPGRKDDSPAAILHGRMEPAGMPSSSPGYNAFNRARKNLASEGAAAALGSPLPANADGGWHALRTRDVADKMHRKERPSMDLGRQVPISPGPPPGTPVAKGKRDKVVVTAAGPVHAWHKTYPDRTLSFDTAMLKAVKRHPKVENPSTTMADARVVGTAIGKSSQSLTRPRTAGFSASNMGTRHEPVWNSFQLTGGLDVDADTGEAGISEARVAALEDALRDALRERRTVYQTSKALLIGVFKSIDDGSGDVDADELARVGAYFGVQMSAAEAAALVRRHGHAGRLPYVSFAHMLLVPPSRALALDQSLMKGAFEAGAPTHFCGKIIYPASRTPVFTPTNWDFSLVDRSAQLPDARLRLEFAHGYQGTSAEGQNLFYVSSGAIAYFLAGLCVVYNRPPLQAQRFYLRHTDDVTAITLCPCGMTIRGVHYPARCIAASGQVTSIEAGPVIAVWDTRTGSESPDLQRIQLDKDARSVIALGFSPSGNLLAAVNTDNSHTVTIYDWEHGRPVGTGAGRMGEPPQVYGLEWCPYEVNYGLPPTFVTFGRKHIKQWTTKEGQWTSKMLTTGRFSLQNVCSAAWLPPVGWQGESAIVGGMEDGSLYIFRSGAAVKCITGHAPGPVVTQSSGLRCCDGVRGMRLANSETILLTGGADGIILWWDVSDGDVKESRFAAPPVTLPPTLGPKGRVQAIRALDWHPSNIRTSEEEGAAAQEGYMGSWVGTVLVGTNACNILEVTNGATETLVAGHSGQVMGLACHPLNPEIAATVSDTAEVMIWDSAFRQLVRMASAGTPLRSVAWSTAPLPPTNEHHLAVGGENGTIVVMKESDLRPQFKGREVQHAIADIKYSPNCRVMAAATAEAVIELFSVRRGYARIARCHGHAATVRSVDFSEDSSVIMSASTDQETLYWDASNGRKITATQRDTRFATWTSCFGFPVMGIWPPDSNGLDVNALDVSHDKGYVATADDFGTLKLFNHPCLVHHAPHRMYHGHSSHIMSVRWSADDSRVLSTGGADKAVFQFRVVKITPEELELETRATFGTS